jgi:hypothetical protein
LKTDANVILYAVDLGELLDWVGCGDTARFEEAWRAVREDEDSDWEEEELQVLERLLRRLVFEGKLYEGLPAEERYYLTQLLIDLFDEFVDQDPLSEDMPLDRLAAEVEKLPRSGDLQMARWLVRGRELKGADPIWKEGSAGDVLSYIGYVTREEAPRLAAALAGAGRRPGGRPSGLIKQLQSAAEECARAELDLVSFVG